MRLKSPKDFLAGILFLAIAVTAIVVTSSLPMGTPRQMGPGYFPIVVAGILAVLSIVLICRGIVIEGPALGPGAGRPAAIVIASVILFGLLLQPLGLVPTVIVSVVVASLANRKFNLLSTMILAVGASIFCAAIFVFALRQQLPIFGHLFG